MRLLYRKISLDSIIDRENGLYYEPFSSTISGDKCDLIKNISLDEKYNPNPNYGKIKTEYINFVIPLHQELSAIGIYLQEPFIATPNAIDDEPDPFIRKQGLRLEKYLTDSNYNISGQTESRLNEIDYYGSIETNFNYADDINSYTGVLQKNNEKIIYVINAENNNGYVNNTGIKYTESFTEKRIIFDKRLNKYIEIPLVNFLAKGQGWTAENVILEEIVKDDKLMGISLVTEVENDINIDRSEYSVFEHHYILGEVKTFTDLSSYRNNYFKLQQ